MDNNFAYLLVGLIVYLLLGPMVDEYLPNAILSTELILRFGFNVMLIIGVWSFRNSFVDIRWGWGLTISALLLTAVSMSIETTYIEHILLLVYLVFCLLSLRLCLYEVVYGGEIDSNRLIGAACVYLLMGVCWAILFFYIETLTPGSFRGLPDEHTLQDFLYFSFVTLTTLGYGDIAPVSQVAQSVSYLEAVAGAVYLAILVGSLVGAFFARDERMRRLGKSVARDSERQD